MKNESVRVRNRLRVNAWKTLTFGKIDIFGRIDYFFEDLFIDLDGRLEIIGYSITNLKGVIDFIFFDICKFGQ